MKKILFGIALLFVAGNLMAQEDNFKITSYSNTNLTTPVNLLDVPADTRAYLKLSLDNPSGKTYVGSQFDIWLPKGWEVAKNNAGNLLTPAKLGDLKNYVNDDEEEISPFDAGIYYRNDPETYGGDEGYFYRIVIYNTLTNEGTSFPTTSNDILRIAVTHTEEASKDVCPITIKNIKLNVSSSDAYQYKQDSYIEYKIGEAGFATLCIDADLDFSAGDLKAYAMSELGAGFATLTEVANVPACAPVVIKGAAGSYQLTQLDTDADAISTNLLKGTPNGEFTADANTFAIAKKTAGTGFYRVKEGVVIPQYKAYLENATAANDFYLFEDATGINTVEKAAADTDVYTITGVKVNNAAQKGIYIQNGKKVVVK